MKLSGILGGVVKLAVLIAIVYGLLQFRDGNTLNDDVEAFAKSACVDEIEDRFDVTRVNPYAVKKNSNGYTVRATATLANGSSAKLNCLTNPHGGVRDVTIDVR